MHVSIGGECLATYHTLVWPLSTVNQHVAVQRTGRAQSLPTDTAGVVSAPTICVMLEVKRGTDVNTLIYSLYIIYKKMSIKHLQFQ